MKHFFISLISFFNDEDVVRGAAGTTMAISFPYMEFFTDSFKFIGAFGGLILLYLSIKHKILEIKKIKNNGNISGS